MYVELYVSGIKKKNWFFENADYKEGFCEVGYKEKERLWSKIIINCKLEVGEVVCYQPYEMYVTVKARVQPKDISRDEYDQFLNEMVNSWMRKKKIKEILNHEANKI